MLNQFELAAARAMLRTLENRPDHAHQAEHLRRYLPPWVITKIKESVAELRSFNRDMAASGGTGLSPQAAEYWKDAKAVLAYGRMVHANPTKAKEATLSRKCEALAESFSHRVPDREKAAFRSYEGDDSDWDDRWYACRDCYFPLLIEQSAGGTSNPSRSAQLEVLRRVISAAENAHAEAYHYQ